MPICQNIQINYNGGIYGNGTEADLAIDEVVGVNHANCVTSYGGQIVDMTGDWNWKEGVGGKISEYDAIIKESAKRLNLDWRLCAALCYTESRFNPKAYNPSGAKGMWQIIFWSENAPSGCKDNSYAYELIKHYKINLKTHYGDLKKDKRSIFIGIIGLASRANITIFEDPLNDANIKDRYDYFNFLYRHHKIYPRTFIITSMFIDEISYLIDKLLFLDRGRVFQHFTIEEINTNFRYLTGKTEVLKSLISGVKIIGVEDRDKTLTVCVCQRLSKDEIRKYQKFQIKMTEVPIYNIFIYLINLREIKEKQ